MNRTCWFALAILLLGTGLRTAAFVSDRSLWIDEAMVALNIVERSPARLLEPLDRNQGAPVGFLLATKVSVTLFGPTERALRLPAFLGSLFGLIATGFAAYRLLPRSAAHLAFALFAVSPHLVGYAAECKQYSADAGFAAVLLAIAAPFFSGSVGSGRWFAFAGVGALSVWCSHPALFVLAGVGLALLSRASIRRDRTRILGLIALGGSWLLSFAAVYAVNLRHLGHNDYLLRYWTGHFAPRPTTRSGGVWYVDHALEFIRESFGLTGDSRIAEGALGSVGLAGLLAMGRRSCLTQTATPGLLLAFALTLALTLLASGVHLYPFAGRLLLFLIPMASIVWGAGAHWLGSRLGRWGIALGWLILVWPLLQSVDAIHEPRRAEEIRPLLNRIHSDWSPGDRIYVYGGSGDAGAGPAFDFYSPQYDFPLGCVIRGGIHRDDPSKYSDEVSKLPPGRTWVLFTHRYRDEESRILAAFSERGAVESVMQVPGGSLHRFQLPP